MNVLFLIPPSIYNQKKKPVDRVYGCNYGFDYKPAIHFLLSATITEQLGHRVRFLDCPAEGVSAKELYAYIRSKEIDIVIFFSVWLSMNEDISAAKIIYDEVKNVKIIFIGPYPTWKPELFIKGENYFVIRGEPEETLKEFLNFINSGKDNLEKIKGLSFLKGNSVINNLTRELLDINSLPEPNYRLLKGRYFFNRIDVYPSTVMCMSRGCSYNCTYCAPNALDQAIELEYSRNNLQKPPLRLKTIENTIKEFREIASLGYRGIEICDNQFIWVKERIVKICEGIRPLKLKWICYARTDQLKDKNMLRLMKEAGCTLIYIGTESFNQEILDDINKQSKVSDNYIAVKSLREVGIEAEISVLLGASGLETEKTILKSISEAKKIRTQFVHYSIALPFPNTRLYKISKERGWLKTGEFIPIDNIRNGILDLPNIKAKALKKIVKRCYLKQYLSMGFLVRQLLNLKSIKGLEYKAKAMIRFLRYLTNSY